MSFRRLCKTLRSLSLQNDPNFCELFGTKLKRIAWPEAASDVMRRDCRIGLDVLVNFADSRSSRFLVMQPNHFVMDDK